MSRWQRAAISYLLFSVQQVLDYYHSLTAKNRESVDVALADTGWPALLAYAPRHRLRREGFKLVFEQG